MSDFANHGNSDADQTPGRPGELDRLLGKDGLTRSHFLRASAALAVGGSMFAVLGCGSDSGGSSSPGRPQALSKPPTTPFDPSVPAGDKPNLPARIAISLPAPGELFTDFSNALSAGAKAHDLEYLSGQANGDSATQFKQTEAFLARGIGALGIIDLAPPALKPLQLRAISKGIPVFAGAYSHTTCQIALDWYEIGKTMGDEAVKWIKSDLGGEAEVVIFNQDSNPSFKPRGEGTRDALKAGGPGIKVVSDIDSPLDAKSSFDKARTVLQKSPNANVWIGKDSGLAGVLAAYKAAGKSTDNVGLFGTDGDTAALKAIETGGAYKVTVGTAYPILAYSWTGYTRDWLDGKSVPLVLQASAIVLSSKETIEKFRADNAAPAESVQANVSTKDYFAPLGNTSYEDNKYLTVVA